MAQKRPFLVADHAGSAVAWAYVWAESQAQIRRLRDVLIITEPPRWLIGQEHGIRTFDVDQLPEDWPARR